MDRRVWFSRRALKLHAVILVVVPGFMALCVWQITRALGGNSLSWAYVFEWPLFAGYAIYMWWRLLHEDATAMPPAAATNGTGGGTEAAGAELTIADGVAKDDASHDACDNESEEDTELAAYNEYLAQLAEQDKAAGR